MRRKLLDNSSVEPGRDGQEDRQLAVGRVGVGDQAVDVRHCEAGAGSDCRALLGYGRGGRDRVGVVVASLLAPAEEPSQVSQVLKRRVGGSRGLAARGQFRGDEGVDVVARDVEDGDVSGDAAEGGEGGSVVVLGLLGERLASREELAAGVGQVDSGQVVEVAESEQGGLLAAPRPGVASAVEGAAAVGQCSIGAVFVPFDAIAGQRLSTGRGLSRAVRKPILASPSHAGSIASGLRLYRIYSTHIQHADSRAFINPCQTRGRSGGIGRRAGFKTRPSLIGAFQGPPRPLTTPNGLRYSTNIQHAPLACFFRSPPFLLSKAGAHRGVHAQPARAVGPAAIENSGGRAGPGRGFTCVWATAGAGRSFAIGSVASRQAGSPGRRPGPGPMLDTYCRPLPSLMGMGSDCRDFTGGEPADNRFVACVVWPAIATVVDLGGLLVGKRF